MNALLNPAVAAAVCVAAAACFATAAQAAAMSGPDVPSAVAAPSGHKPAMTLRGVGHITYECRAKAGASGAWEWAFVAPDAALQDGNGMQVGKYYGGPT